MRRGQFVRMMLFAASVGQGGAQVSSATSRDKEEGRGQDVKK
jgi:hypothetical protein